MLPHQLEIYKASAGSGKTFLLTMHYLQLLFTQPNNHRHILAVTFTNKATAEMKERISEALRHMADGKRTIYAAQLLQKMPDKNFDDLQKQATIIYSAILHDYSRFSVTTIDSFVQRIIRSFAFEIGLDAGFRLQLNATIVKEALADKLFVLLDTDEELRHWVSGLAINRLSEGKNWNFRDEMLELASEIFKEDFQEFEIALKQLPDLNEAFKTLRQKVYVAVNSFEKVWKKTGQQALQLLSANGLGAEDFYYGKGGFINYFFKAEKGVIEKPSERVKKIVEDPMLMEGKKTNAAISAIRSQLHFLLQKLVNLHSEERIEYNTALAIARNIGNLRLMQVFSEQLSHYRSENNMLLISDTHLLLRQLTRETEASFIYEKTGNRFRHFLIDEFQDTSGFQWDNFKPLVENTLAEGNYNLLVGDVKQAIYRWRSGNWELLHRKVKEQLQSFEVEDHSLQENWRSAKPIIEFNNYLFRVAPALLQEEFASYAADAPESIRSQLLQQGYFSIIENAYKESYQQQAESAPDDGLVDIKFVDKTDENDEPVKFEEQVLPRLHETIANLLHEGFSSSDIAILTRDNKEAAMVINFLMAAQQQPGSICYNLVSADALLIKNNQAIHIIVAAMEWLEGRNGRLALVQLRQAFSTYKNDNATTTAIFLQKGEEERVLPERFIARVESLHQLALIDLVNELIQVFELNRNEADTAYLLAFQDMLSQWGRYGSDGLTSFLEYWEEEGIKTSLPAGGHTNAIEVLTIHKSKGLAFSILLLPFLNWEVKPDATKSTQLWVHTGSTSFNEIPVVPVRFNNALMDSHFAFQRIRKQDTNEYKDEGYFPELLLGMMDNLNLLYVATTRARRRIIGWAPKPAKTEGLSTIDKLLYAAAKSTTVSDISHSMQGVEQVEILESLNRVQQSFDASNEQWLHGSDNSKPEHVEMMPALMLPSLIQNNWKEKLTVRYKPLLTEEEQALQLPRKLGVLMHEALALLQHPSEVEKVMQFMMQKGMLTGSQQTHAGSTLGRIIAIPLLKEWADNSMHRLSEKDIITVDKQLRRPDLILYNNERTNVIDFKFTAVGNDAPRYESQVREYVNLLKQLGFKNVSGYLLYAGDEMIDTVEVL